MTPKEFRDKSIGKSFDFDKYPVYNPFQCWDYFKYFVTDSNIPVNTYCAISGYVCDLWRLKEQYGYETYFSFIKNPDKLKNGDWMIWDKGSSHVLSHIAMYYDGYALGQNQSKRYVTEATTKFDIMGALRPRFWDVPQKGYAEHFSKDFAHIYACGFPLNLRSGGSTDYASIMVMPKNKRVTCYGYYHVDNDGRIWLYVSVDNITGFCCMDYLYKIK